jgi:D-alanyl-D-alanine endopeptidase (penicillin-binding protein 7)
MKRLVCCLSLLACSIPLSAFAEPAPAGTRASEPPIRVETDNETVYISNVPGVGTPLPQGQEIDVNSRAPEAVAPVRKGLVIREGEPAVRDARTAPRIDSAVALVVDQRTGQLIYAKNASEVRSIASITKLMTAMVVLDSGLPLNERITLDYADTGALTSTKSRLRAGMTFTRGELLKLALMASENPAAAALAHSYPGGTALFVHAMNEKARSLGLRNTRFFDPTGLQSGNVSTSYELAMMADAAYGYPLIREFTTSGSHSVALKGTRHLQYASFSNTNRLIGNSEWHIGLSKTGFINQAGRCLVMQATIAERPVIIVLLDASDRFARADDAVRIKHWLEGGTFQRASAMSGKRRM